MPVLPVERRANHLRLLFAAGLAHAECARAIQYNNINAYSAQINIRI